MTTTDPAARAWALMTAVDPMPVPVAVDFVREALGTDDLWAVFLAVCGAAGGWGIGPRPTVSGRGTSRSW